MTHHDRPEEHGTEPLDSPDTDAPQNDSEGVEKPDGLGEDNTIPNEEDGLAAGHSEEPSTFEPEEDQ